MENLKIFNNSKKINLLIVSSAALIMAVLCLINYSEIDIEIQNYFFDFDKNIWAIDSSEPIKKFIFYKFPKIIFGVGVLSCLVGAVLGFQHKNKTEAASQKFSKNRHRFLLIFLGLALIPLLAGNVKKITNVYCPAQLEIYGGNYPYAKIFEHYREGFEQQKRAACFPAGHAITGFALFILFFAFEKTSHQILGLSFALVIGWILALYQMLKGAHFFGDSLVSMLLCFLLAAVISRIYLFKFQNDKR